MTLLSVESLSVDIGETPVLKSVSLTLEPGEILGLVGASRSGKSLTALAILQLAPPRARIGGTVQLNGRLLSALDERRMCGVRGCDIGIVFQEPMTALNPSMKVGQQVAETVRLHGRTTKARADAAARSALQAVGVAGDPEFFERYPYELSGGQRQRVAIAIAVVLQPALLIADEPTTALDVRSQAQVLSVLVALVRERQMGLILISHDLAVISQVADRVAIMHAGEIVEHGATQSMLRNLQHPYAQALRAAAEPITLKLARPEPDGAAILEVRELVREYPRRRRSLLHAAVPLRAVDHVSLCVHAGETVGLVGESGCGKSSLLRGILGLEPIAGGEVRLLGESFSAASAKARKRLRRALQAVFQDPYDSFDPRWSVERIVAEPFCLLEQWPRPGERRRKIATVLEQVGLAYADARRHPHEFSGGQRQRIAIARALITEPAIIAFDEAVSALDVMVRAQIFELLASLSRLRKLAYLFVSHDLGVVRAIADRVYVMQCGRIVEEGVTREVFAAPRAAYTRLLIEATPRLRV